jgi:hypothetical protein
LGQGHGGSRRVELLLPPPPARHIIATRITATPPPASGIFQESCSGKWIVEMVDFNRGDVLPALLRPGMYAGEPGDRSNAEWLADAVVAYLNAKTALESRARSAGASASADTDTSLR